MDNMNFDHELRTFMTDNDIPDVGEARKLFATSRRIAQLSHDAPAHIDVLLKRSIEALNQQAVVSLRPTVRDHIMTLFPFKYWVRERVFWGFVGILLVACIASRIKPGVGEQAAYDPSKAVAYARTYGLISSNTDGCYIYTTPPHPTEDGFQSGTIHCGGAWNGYDSTRDGAHFLDCTLKAGGLARVSCSSPLPNLDPGGSGGGLGSGSRGGGGFAPSMDDLVTELITYPHEWITNPQDVRPGDIALQRTPQGSVCWGGIVVERDTDFLFGARQIIDESSRLWAVPSHQLCYGRVEESFEYLRLYPQQAQDGACIDRYRRWLG
jgi:hypothetical protein